MQNMKSVENTRRELFEDWFKDANETRISRGFDDYTGWEKSIMCRAFNAALDSVVIELPKLRFSSEISDQEWHSIRNESIKSCARSIESTNLGLKIK